jgi:hypothetical protein
MTLRKWRIMGRGEIMRMSSVWGISLGNKFGGKFSIVPEILKLFKKGIQMEAIILKKSISSDISN